MYARIKERAAFYFTEQGGFEPPVPRSTTVFKTAALNHSATAPQQWNLYYPRIGVYVKHFSANILFYYNIRPKKVFLLPLLLRSIPSRR